MYPELFKIGTFTIYSYGVMVSLGFIAGILTALWLGRREGIKLELILDAVLWVMISAILGARLFFVIEYWRGLDSPLEIFMIWRGGLVFYGGLIAGIGALIFFCLKHKLSLLKILDIAAPCAAIGYAIGRIGCFLRGCCYGIVSNYPWAVKFPDLLLPRHPTQLYAALSGLLIFGILLFLYRFRKFDGQIFSVGLILYSVYRFLNEFLRLNPRYILGLSGAQIISIFLFIFAIGCYGILYYRKKQQA